MDPCCECILAQSLLIKHTYPTIVSLFSFPLQQYACEIATLPFPTSLLKPVSWASLVAQTVKRLPTMWETWVQSLGQEDLLEKEMATHSSILAWKIPWMEEPGRLQSMESQRPGHD